MTYTELKKQHEAENTYFTTGPSRWDDVPVFDGTVDIEYTYDDWLNDYGNMVFKNLVKPYGIDSWGDIPTELSFYVKQEDHNFNLVVLLKIDCRITLTKEVDGQIKARQRQYIDQQAERVLALLKEDYEFKKPIKENCIDFIRHWIFGNLFEYSTKPDLLFAKSDNVFLSGKDDYTEPNFDTIREAYKTMHSRIGVREPFINCKWVVPNFLGYDIDEAQIVTLAYIRFLGYLESLIIPVVPPAKGVSVEVGFQILKQLKLLTASSELNVKTKKR